MRNTSTNSKSFSKKKKGNKKQQHPFLSVFTTKCDVITIFCSALRVDVLKTRIVRENESQIYTKYGKISMNRVRSEQLELSDSWQ